jgi:FixJ family two-component response regulator
MVAGERSKSMHQKEIFIVDDNEEYRELLAAILELEGFEVTGFSDGMSFLENATSRVPVCVFLDVILPGRSGLDILKTLIARKFVAPIFMISARRDNRVIVEAIKSGARDFIEKPFDPYTAVLRVRDAVELWGRRAADAMAPRQQFVQYVPGVKFSHMERAVLLQIIAGGTNAEVAASLGIGKQSVANHRWRVTRKCGAKNSADLARIMQRGSADMAKLADLM